MSSILIVEDDQSMARLLQTLLSLEGHQALSTPRPEEVVGKIREMRPDVVVMDLHLGHVETLDIVREIKRDPALRPTPVIIVSGMEAADRCARAGADAFMLKPYSPSTLLEKIRELI